MTAKTLLNRKAVKAFALNCASFRAHEFTRVGKEFFETVNARLEILIRQHIDSLPSVGKTIK